MYEETQPLLSQRIIVLAGSFTEDTYIELSWCLYTLRKQDADKPIVLRITSPGGSGDYSFALIDLIQADDNVWGVALGKVASAAANIFLACKRRYVTHHTLLGIHQCNFGEREVTTAADHKAMAIELDKRNHQMATLLHKASLNSMEYWMNAIIASPLELMTYDYEDMKRMGIARPYADLAEDLETALADK